MRKSIKVIKARTLKRRTKRKFHRKTMRKGGGDLPPPPPSHPYVHTSDHKEIESEEGGGGGGGGEWETEASNGEWETEAEAWNEDHKEEESFDLSSLPLKNPVLKHENTSSIQLFKELTTLDTHKNLFMALLKINFMKRITFGKKVDEVTYRKTPDNIYFTIKHNKKEILHISLHQKTGKYTSKKYLRGAFHIQKGQQGPGNPKPLIQRILIYEDNGMIQLSLYQEEPGKVYEPRIQEEAEILLRILGAYYQITHGRVVIL